MKEKKLGGMGTQNQTDAVRARYDDLGNQIRDREERIESCQYNIKSLIDEIRAIRKEAGPLRAYLKAAGELPRAKRKKKGLSEEARELAEDLNEQTIAPA